MKKPTGLKYVVLVSCSLVILSCTTVAQKHTMPEVAIVEYGTYKIEPTGTVPAAEASGGRAVKSRSFELLERTDTIRVSVGTVFGIVVAYYGSEGGSIDVESHIIHPEMKDPYLGKTTTLSSIDRKLYGQREFHFAYQLEEPWEMVTGDWTFQIVYRGEVLCEKTFHLVQ